MRDELSERLRPALRNAAYPVWRFPDGTVLSAANVWAASRHWVAFGRSHGLDAGDRVSLRAEPSPGFLAALVAGICEQWTMRLLPATTSSREAEVFGARAHFGFEDGPGAAPWDNAGNPRPLFPPAPRTVPICPSARFLLRSSGSTGHPSWFALSAENVLAVLDSHLPLLGWDSNTRIVSVLPWHHAFGFVLELLGGILSGAAFLRCAPDGAAILETARAFHATHFLGVPAHVFRIGEIQGGIEFLKSLSGGIIGGAAIDGHAAALLRSTRLRCGYGQTEASPGITLGEPGEFEPGFLGRPVGCEVRIAEDGELLFRGPNACLGTASEDGIEFLDPRGWRHTGDLAREENGRYFFQGRKSSGWKLPNGTWFHPFETEQKLVRELSGAREALLLSHDASGWISVRIEAGQSLDSRSVMEAMGGLSRLVKEVRIIPCGALPRSSKGELLRKP